MADARRGFENFPAYAFKAIQNAMFSEARKLLGLDARFMERWQQVALSELALVVESPEDSILRKIDIERATVQRIQQEKQNARQPHRSIASVDFRRSTCLIERSMNLQQGRMPAKKYGSYKNINRDDGDCDRIALGYGCARSTVLAWYRDTGTE